MEDLKRNKTTAAQAIGIEDSKDHLFRPREKHTVKYFELLKQRRARPVSSRRQEFLDAYHQYQVSSLSAILLCTLRQPDSTTGDRSV